MASVGVRSASLLGRLILNLFVTSARSRSRARKRMGVLGLRVGLDIDGRVDLHLIVELNEEHYKNVKLAQPGTEGQGMMKLWEK